MIFVSDQAFISKWWWIGAIRKRRRPQYLNEKTWRITESASTTKIPPIRSSSTSVFVIIANAAERAADRHRARVAHEHLGGEGVVPEEADRPPDQRRAEDREVERRRVAQVDLARRADERDDGHRRERDQRDDPVPAASPSIPSVRFTPFAAPAITRKSKM